MDYRGVFLICVLGSVGVLGASTACSGPDPGAITFAERPSSGGGEPQSGTTSSGTPSDGGSVEAAAPDPIFGTTAFAYVDPGVTANNANAAHAGTVEGKDCMVAGCHLDGPKVWVFGGTMYTAAAGGTTVPKAQIKIVGPTGAEIGTTYTDANGNFWLDKAGTNIPVGSKVGVRREGGTRSGLMQTGLQTTDNGCNRAGTCHGGQTGHVFPN